jgi:hypothetical protein
MEKLRDVVRMKVDALRMSKSSGARDPHEVAGALASSIGSETVGRLSEEHDSQGNVLHVCPWHTCQATLHN